MISSSTTMSLEPSQQKRNGASVAGSTSWKDHLALAGTYGTGMGVAGMFFGYSRGVWTHGHPRIAALTSGIRWFLLGSNYTFFRKSLMEKCNSDKMSPTRKIGVSTVAGAAAGAVAGILDGPLGILAGGVIYSVFGAAGQTAYGLVEGVSLKPEGGWGKLAPVRRISDEEYAQKLERKLLAVEADIALLDERVAVARARILATKKKVEAGRQHEKKQFRQKT